MHRRGRDLLGPVGECAQPGQHAVSCWYRWRVGSLTLEYRVLMILTVLGSVPIYSLMQVYHKRHEPGWSGLSRLLAAWPGSAGGV